MNYTTYITIMRTELTKLISTFPNKPCITPSIIQSKHTGMKMWFNQTTRIMD